MKSRFEVQVVALLATLSLASTVTSAGTYVFDLPVPPQSLAYGDPDIVLPFSAGMMFESIDLMTVEVFGTGESGLIGDAEPGAETHAFSPPLIIVLPPVEDLQFRIFAELEEIAGTSRWWASFRPKFDDFRNDVPREILADFLDGEAELAFSSDNAFFTTGWSLLNILKPSIIQFESVRVTIVGQAVPEPSSEVLVVLALLVAGCWVRGSWTCVPA